MTFSKNKNFIFKKVDIRNYNALEKIFIKYKIDTVVHLAAQAGVRYSLKNPKSYVDNNISGFFNILDISKNFKIKKFIYASTSSIYGIQKKYPLKEKFETSNPIQLYAATKKSNEVIAASYSHLYNIKTIGLRFLQFTDLGDDPIWPYLNLQKIFLKGKPIHVFNHGKHSRDFTYVGDIVGGIFKILTSRDKKKLIIFITLVMEKKYHY